MKKFIFLFAFLILVPLIDAKRYEETEKVSRSILRQGEGEEKVQKLQEVLKEKGYYFSEIDGIFGPETRYAVIAFQKVNKIQVDGIVGPQTWQVLENSRRPSPRYKERGIHIEIDLERQLLFIIKDETIIGISHISSGKPGRETPTGRFEVPNVEKVICKTRNVPWNATLFYPIQIRGAYLIHGFAEKEGGVPLYPASKGCVRVPISISYWLAYYSGIEKGTIVYIY